MLNVLETLLSDGFIASVGVVSSARGLRRHLYKSEYVSNLRKALEGGAISENDIRSFVQSIMIDFERSTKFPHELALAAISVALETRKSEFAEEYLLDLARLNITELSFSPIVARESLRLWSALPKYRERVKKFADSSRSRRKNLKSNRFVYLIFTQPVRNLSKVIRFREKANGAS